MITSDKIDKVAVALAAIQADLGGLVDKDGTAKGAKFSYSYTTLPTLVAKVNPIAANQGCAILHTQTPDGVTCTLLHTSGQWIAVDALVPPNGDAQARGSALSYGRRYSLQSLLGLASDDDDGRASKDSDNAADEERDRLANVARIRRGIQLAIQNGALTEVDVADCLGELGVTKVAELDRGGLAALDRMLRER